MKNTQFKLILIAITTLFISTTTLVVPSSSQADGAKQEASETRKSKSTWQRLISLFQNKKRTTHGSRGACLVSPGILDNEDAIWHNQPSFLWRSNSPKLEVRLYYDRHDRNRPIWRQKITDNSSSLKLHEITDNSSSLKLHEIIYHGKPLQQGQRYDWEIFEIDQTGTTSSTINSFTVMAEDDYNSIAQDLHNIETQLTKQRISQEQIILAKANYFLEKGLLSDALTQIALIENPSLEFRQQKESLLADLCIPKQ